MHYNWNMSATIHIMLHPPRARWALAALTLLAVLERGAVTTAAADRDDKGKEPSVSLKVTPGLASAPVQVRASAEIRGGPDDYEEFYCPTIEWDWGDDTKSESAQDCEPYEAGRSTIRRRFSIDHRYQVSGSYKVSFRMKRKGKVVASAAVNVQVQPGLSEHN